MSWYPSAGAATPLLHAPLGDVFVGAVRPASALPPSCVGPCGLGESAGDSSAVGAGSGFVFGERATTGTAVSPPGAGRSPPLGPLHPSPKSRVVIEQLRVKMRRES